MTTTPKVPARFLDRQLDDHTPVKKMFRPEEYGRGVDHAHIKKIVAKWDERAVGRVIVSLRADGKFAVIDGNHRREAALHLGIEALPATVFIDLTEEEEAFLFTLYNTTKKLTAIDIVRAEVANRDKTALEIRSVLRRNGLDFALHGRGEGKVGCVAALKEIYETHGLTFLADVIRLIVAGFGIDDRNAYTIAAVAGTASFWIRYRYDADEVRLLERLHATDAISLLIEARKMSSVFKEGLSVGWGRAVRNLYNSGLHKNQLAEWQRNVYSDRAKAAVAEKAKETIGKLRAEGRTFGGKARAEQAR